VRTAFPQLREPRPDEQPTPAPVPNSTDKNSILPWCDFATKVNFCPDITSRIRGNPVRARHRP
jgi:hypothetical protein